MAQAEAQSLESRARRRARYLSGLLWHAGAFVIINGFFWILDVAGPGGVDWASWITCVWALALAFHGLAYLIDGRQLEEHKTQQYLEDERRRAARRR
jgi:apolipoprotein N-acyltransferase